MSFPDAIKHFPFATQIFIRKIYNRIEKGKNCLIVVVGATGSGKSWATINLMLGLELYRYGKLKDWKYYLDHCVFKAKDLMEGLNDPKLKKKTVWVWDEAGIDAGSQEHATVKNKVIGWLTQTFRNLQQVVFFTLPSQSMLTYQVRKLLHYYLEAEQINAKKKYCVVKPLEIQYNTRMDKIYYHNVIYTTNRGMLEIDRMAVPLAPKSMLDIYEEKKSQFTQDLNQQIQAMLEKVERKENPNSVDMAWGHKQIYVLWHCGITRQVDMKELLPQTPQGIGQILKTMDKKNPVWRIEPNLLEKSTFESIKRDLSPHKLKSL